MSGVKRIVVLFKRVVIKAKHVTSIDFFDIYIYIFLIICLLTMSLLILNIVYVVPFLYHMVYHVFVEILIFVVGSSKKGYSKYEENSKLFFKSFLYWLSL